jgi:hypothetical protein
MSALHGSLGEVKHGAAAALMTAAASALLLLLLLLLLLCCMSLAAMHCNQVRHSRVIFPTLLSYVLHMTWSAPGVSDVQ